MIFGLIWKIIIPIKIIGCQLSFGDSDLIFVISISYFVTYPFVGVSQLNVIFYFLSFFLAFLLFFSYFVNLIEDLLARDFLQFWWKFGVWTESNGLAFIRDEVCKSRHWDIFTKENFALILFLVNVLIFGSFLLSKFIITIEFFICVCLIVSFKFLIKGLFFHGLSFLIKFQAICRALNFQWSLGGFRFSILFISLGKEF